MNKKLKITLVLCSVAVLAISLVVASCVFGGKTRAYEIPEDVVKSKYQNILINGITGEGDAPPEITGTASDLAREKEWYEYLIYSPQPVASFRISDDERLVFFDPYEYSSALIMEITGEESAWSSANSITVSYTTGNTISTSDSTSENVSSSVQVQDGRDESGSHTRSSSTSTTLGWSTSASETISAKVGVKATAGVEVAKVETSVEESVSATIGATASGSGTIGNNESSTEGWSIIANRITSTTGSSFSKSKSISASNSTTVSRTFNAGYFNASGSPLQWKIVCFSVYMPLKVVVEYKIDGEWVATDSDYCLLTTMQGTCRAYMQNDTAYVEHWGTGEPVTWNDFWKGFFTKQQLIDAYQNKLYPDD